MLARPVGHHGRHGTAPLPGHPLRGLHGISVVPLATEDRRATRPSSSHQQPEQAEAGGPRRRSEGALSKLGQSHERNRVWTTRAPWRFSQLQVSITGRCVSLHQDQAGGRTDTDPTKTAYVSSVLSGPYQVNYERPPNNVAPGPVGSITVSPGLMGGEVRARAALAFEASHLPQDTIRTHLRDSTDARFAAGPYAHDARHAGRRQPSRPPATLDRDR